MSQPIPTTIKIMSPLRLLTTLVLIIFVLETLIMLLLPYLLPYIKGIDVVLVDSLLLAILSTPFIWWFVARPLRNAAVTEVARSYLLLEEQKEFAESLVQNSTTPTFVLDGAHRVISWNLACEGLTGVKAVDMLGKDEHWNAFYDQKRPLLADFLIDGNLEDIVQYHQIVSKSKVIPEGMQADGWFQDMNGGDRFVIISAAPIRNKLGELIAVIETLEDITERKRAEEKTQQTLSLLTATLEATADAIVVTGLDGRAVVFNRQFVEMWQIPESILNTEEEMQVLQRILGQLKHPDEYAARIREQHDCPELESRSVTELIDGRIIERYSKPQRIGGKVVGRVRSFRDITEQRNLESQLRHSQKMEAIGTLAGGVAHDFNNILTAIIGFGELMKMKMATDDPFLPMVAKILTAANRAAELTKSLLAFSRKQVMELRAVDVNSVVKGVEKLLVRLLREDIDLRITFADEPCTVMADKGQIEQVLMNLTTNARDALPNGGILAINTSITKIDRDFIETHGYGEPGRYVLLTVGDTGEGIDEATRIRIFEPFFTTKEVGQGTGLGLSMAHGIIKQHNGYISCYSEPGNGTTFRIYLPASDTPAEVDMERPIELMSGGTETILLAEDDTQVRNLTRELLEQFGYTVIEAIDGKDAVTQFLVHGSDIQLALLDVIMPGKNGRDAFGEMRKIAPGLKALFTSGYSADIQQKEFYGPGFAFIYKPATPTELLKAVRNVLDENLSTLQSAPTAIMLD